MDDNKDTGMAQTSGATLRRPVQIVKKRSGPLDDALNELHLGISDKQSTPDLATRTATPIFATWQVTPTDAAVKLPTFAVSAPSPQAVRRRPTIKEKEKKRERWLLTRKTWKYMTDAGRKLIPDGAQNRKEDILKIETHFQQVCANESRFILWRRKSSYPGAVRNSKRRLKHLLQHTGQKEPPTIDALEQLEANNADQIIDILQSYLKLGDAYKTTTLLSSKTVRPDQTASPSARRPGKSGNSFTSTGNNTSMGPVFLSPQLPKSLQQLNEIDQLLERLRMLSRSVTTNIFTIPPENITPAILEDKALLKQVYNSLKKQQLHRVLSKHSTPPLKNPRSKLKHSSSLSSLTHFGSGAGAATRLGDGGKDPDVYEVARGKDQSTSSVEPTTPTIITTGTTPKKHLRTASKYVSSVIVSPTPAPRQRKPPSTLDLPGLCSANKNSAPPRRAKEHPIEKHFNSCGTQTNFVPLQEIKRLAEEYKEQKREEAALSTSTIGTPGATDDEAEKGFSTASAGGQHHRRKSSIDNEDVSQSVSDTIKRYLRMARKKSVHDDNANRFKRVNYDRNLRNIKAKGEINPPGMDEGNSKAVQTLDAWPVISLDFIRGNESSSVLEAAHIEWQKALDDRIKKRLEYEQRLSCQNGASYVGVSTSEARDVKPTASSCNSSSAPTSPISNEKFESVPATSSFGSGVGGLRLAGSQFLSNLWHGASSNVHEDGTRNNNAGRHCSQSHPGTSLLKFHRGGKGDHNPGHNDSFSKDANLEAAMQKSKSSSNVGQFVTRKILKGRSKSQTRPNTQAPLSKWAPAEKFTWTSDNGGRILIQDSCLQNLTDIEAKILQRVAIEKINELNIGVNVVLDHDGKSQKRRVLPKKKAITTSFFDISKKEDQSGGSGIFGNSLECCLVNDKKRDSNLKASSERGSRNSIAALFRSGCGSESSSKLNENVRSYESLPSSTSFLVSPHRGDNRSDSGRGKSSSAYFGPLSKSTSMQMSQSQSDIRRRSQDFDLHGFKLQDSTDFKDLHETNNNSLQVPSFITSCIRYLEEHGLNKVGLFRVSTSKKRVKQMREDFDKNSVTNIDDETCPHDVATLLKEFLRDLPEPLLCSGLYKAFLETQRIRNRRLQLEAISHLVKLLPVAHRDTLYVLLKFLAKVASCSDDIAGHDGNTQISGNKMDSNNLATVFAPNILRTTLKSSSTATADVAACGYSNEQESMSDAINVIRIMIDHCEEIFKVSAELIDVVYSHMLDMCPEKLYCLFEQRSQSVRDDIANSCSSLSSPELIVSPTSNTRIQSTSASNIPSCVGVGVSSVQSKTSAKRLYTRESVMHDNDASRAPDATTNGSNEMKRYSNTHNNRPSTTQKICHDERKANSQNSEPIDRRQSSPNILDKFGVLSA
ncbi:uncharacterized protein LOC118745557, partial [Rhagoletis pomonella]